ncbi:UTP--glucose-1-phosphate uridylyltransferase GalU [Loktanella sp. SALINAS62]|uniref:UTP--glucose-1-phosphate uridylyltransferase GalU n=1 Tax=Loktanella sp. SALINAS62 TaxID=2706124 RepID=UPI001B8B0D56|nr:UTP--glucose-1-phosphate uridylyltransferase GalU [Loktanella sp. SALINAS62]MBS1302502.1 UTP--glucose-1-phosphate uridylyltransferase GalU [Loktanella sp. SALINAS62]
MRRKVSKAIFPVAGMGTRFLPATKAVPKEIMTLVDRPLVQYAIDEAREAGIKEFIFVTARGKNALEDYFDNAPELENRLRKDGKTELLETLKSTNMESGAIAYIRQHKAMGLGHAVWCARRLIGNEPFAVMLPDDVIASEKSCLAQMVDAYEDCGGSMVATMEVAPEQTKSYGILDVAETDADQGQNRLVRARGMVEKPAPGTAPSNLAVIGRYILTPDVMSNLNHIGRGSGNEVQLTDAIAAEIRQDRDVFGYRFEGKRYDCGSKAGYLEATVAFALANPELGEGFRKYLNEIVAKG